VGLAPPPGSSFFNGAPEALLPLLGMTAARTAAGDADECLEQSGVSSFAHGKRRHAQTEDGETVGVVANIRMAIARRVLMGLG